MIDLKQKVAIVTGGGSGIGRAMALALAGQGVRVVLCGRRLSSLEAVRQTIQTNGGLALAVQADVAVADDVTRLVQTTVDSFGSVHILVNNAGISGGGYIHQHDLDQWDRIMAINLRGPFLLARAVLPLMRQQHEGHIINISSESGLEYYPGNGAYGVSKHALNALGEYIQRENQESGIRVNTICPGMVVTEMTQGASGLNEAKCLQPEEIAELALWLLTRQANLKIGRPVLIQTMENPWQV
jgi:NAD(P)-dependent dehydrogenase (short-subunit alcohol dehydrogenase family)